MKHGSGLTYFYMLFNQYNNPVTGRSDQDINLVLTVLFQWFFLTIVFWTLFWKCFVIFLN
jgi:hypothetical protein